MGPVWERVKPLLPQHLGGGDLTGLNARWRLYRYDQGTGEHIVLQNNQGTVELVVPLQPG